MKKLRVTVRRVVAASPVEGEPDNTFAEADEALAYWRGLYFDTYGIAYEAETKTMQDQLVYKIVSDVGLAMAKRLMFVLLRHKGAEWIVAKTLSFLAKPTNRSYLVPHTLKRQLDFKQERTSTVQITFRK